MEGDGADVRTQYQVKAYPTLLFLDSRGAVVKKFVGYREPDLLIELAQKANDPEKNTIALNAKFEQGSANYEVINNLLQDSQNDSEKEEYLQRYFGTIEIAQWSNPKNWELIKNYAPIASTYFTYLLTNEELLGSLYGKLEVDKVIFGKFKAYYQENNNNTTKVKAAEYVLSFHRQGQ